jgi:hypothetical protein
MDKCETFCRNEYVPKSNRLDKKYYKTLKRKFAPNQKYQAAVISLCKKTFCNPKCVGFKKNKIKNGFLPGYSKKMRTKVLSGCLDTPFLRSLDV